MHQPPGDGRPQRFTVSIHVAGTASDWPEDVAAIYAEINAEDRRLAETLFPTVRETWPLEQQ